MVFYEVSGFSRDNKKIKIKIKTKWQISTEKFKLLSLLSTKLIERLGKSIINIQ